MRINQNKSNSKKWVLITITVLVLIGGLTIGYFTWYLPSQNSDDNTQIDTNVVNNTIQDNSVTHSTDESVQNERDIEKSPEQYEGQNESGDTSNANCIDADCSNFAIPTEDNQ